MVVQPQPFSLTVLSTIIKLNFQGARGHFDLLNSTLHSFVNYLLHNHLMPGTSYVMGHKDEKKKHGSCLQSYAPGRESSIA